MTFPATSAEDNVREDDPRPLILVSWDYARRSWLEPFTALRDRFRFVFINKAFPEPDERNPAQVETTYFSQFATPQRLLAHFRPRKVIFMGLDDSFSIALNATCKRRRIPTYQVQHGVNFRLKTSLENEKLSKVARAATTTEAGAKSLGRSRQLQFLLAGLNGNVREFFRFLAFTRQRNEVGTIHALHSYRTPGSTPDYFVGFSPFTTEYYREVFGATEDQLIHIGWPEYDPFFGGEGAAPEAGEKYYLLIDQPLVENKYRDFGVSAEEMNTFYAKLNAFCLDRGARLKIKLHPESYGARFMMEHPNIEYLRQANLVEIIKNSEGCFGTFSSLMVPAVYFKPCAFFSIIRNDIEREVVEMGVSAAYDFRTFDPKNLELSGIPQHPAKRAQFERRFLHRVDGGAVQRLGEVLAADSPGFL